jgi:DNA-binding response OmpR family regulator
MNEVLNSKILIIDSNKQDTDSLSVLLHGEGYRVSCSGSGYEGIRKVKEGDFDLIVMDLSLPDINGKDLIRQIRKSAKEKTPLIILSEQDEVEDIEEFFQRGVDDYIVKPPRFSYLLSKIGQLINP